MLTGNDWQAAFTHHRGDQTVKGKGNYKEKHNFDFHGFKIMYMYCFVFR